MAVWNVFNESEKGQVSTKCFKRFWGIRKVVSEKLRFPTFDFSASSIVRWSFIYNCEIFYVLYYSLPHAKLFTMYKSYSLTTICGISYAMPENLRKRT